MKTNGTAMNIQKKAQPLTEQEIDKIVVAQADEEAAWGKPVRVRRTKTLEQTARDGDADKA